MTNTPETDSAMLLHFDEPVVPLSFARKLERERDEAHELLGLMTRERNGAQKALIDVAQGVLNVIDERDQLRAVCDELAVELNGYLMANLSPGCIRASPATYVYNSLPHVKAKAKL